ncbi:MAG: hypothetical protein R3F05_20850 [Planctomycetota bacterium]
MARVLLLCIAVALPFAPSHDAHADVRASERAKIEKAFAAYLRTDDEKSRDKIWKGIEKLADKLSITEIEEIVRTAAVGDDWDRGYTDEIAFGAGGETWTYSLLLPRTKPKGLVPLVVDVGHASWKDADATKREEGIRTWLRAAGAGDDVAYLRTRVLDKLSLDGRYEAWTAPPRRPLDKPNLDTLGSIVLAAIGDACHRYPIDPDRVHVQGISQTGYWTWWLAQMAPDRWAAAAPVGAVTMHVRKMVPNVVGVPLFVLHGTADPTCPFAQAKGMVDDIKQAGGTVDFRPTEGGGHMDGVFVRFAEIWPEMARRTRDAYPKRVERKITSDLRPGAYWLRAGGIEAREFNPWGPPCHLTGTIDGQTVEITATGCRQVTVFLSPHLLDVDQDVTINVGGKQAWRGRLEPDPRAALELARTRGDAATYGASVTLEP